MTVTLSYQRNIKLMNKLKILIHALLIYLIFSCQSDDKQVSSQSKDSITLNQTQAIKSIPLESSCWIGFINKMIPISVQYSVSDSLLIGEIIYTNENIPITLIGQLENNNYRLLEYDKDGNITGIIIGKPLNQKFVGKWYSPKSDKEYSIELNSMDACLFNDFQMVREDMFGSYKYSYGKFATKGEFEIKKVNDSLISFSVFSTGNGEVPNIADVPEDTISLFKGDSFVYTILESDNCEFKVRFLKNFVFIKYTKGYCDGQFGLNTSIDGVFIKTKS